MRIGVDIMGGDYAPLETTLGCIRAASQLPDDTGLVLFGDREQIIPILEKNGASAHHFEIIHCSEVITFNDSPTKALVQKPQSSLAVGFNFLKEKKIDGFASAGNTGAMMVGAMFSVKSIPGILRPTISSILPKESGGVGLILDVGINADCKPEVLQQFGIIGSLFAEFVYHIPNPKVGLMNIGEEEEKGNLLSQAAFELLKNTRDIRFIGNVEGRDLFNDKADVIVCDGFTGNVILKQAESFYTLIKKRNIHDPYFDRFDFEDYGGTPLLGVNSTVVIAHGISRAKAIANMILLTKNVVEARMVDRIAHALSASVVS